MAKHMIAKPQFMGNWDKNLLYCDGAAVFHYINGTGSIYESTKNNNNTEPGTLGCAWINKFGSITETATTAWQLGVAYDVDETVGCNGAIYVCTNPHLSSMMLKPGTTAMSESYWRFLPGTKVNAHQDTHISGDDQLPSATTATRGLMTISHVNDLTEAKAQLSILDQLISPEGALDIPNVALGVASPWTLKGNLTDAENIPSDYSIVTVVEAFGLEHFVNKTLTPELTGASLSTEVPTAEAVVSYIENLMAANSGSIHVPFGTIAELQAVDTTDSGEWPDKILIFIEEAGLYRFDSAASMAADGTKVIAPAVGTGRFIKMFDVLASHAFLSGVLGDGMYHLSEAQVSKLNGIETGAQVNLTPEEIVAAINTVAGFSALTDAQKAKLDFITVTSAVNLTTLASNLATVINKADANEAALSTHSLRTDNPHTVTATQVGLGNVVDKKDYFSADVVPSTSLNFAAGYREGSIGWKGTAGYVCTDAANGIWARFNGEIATALSEELTDFFKNRTNHIGTQPASSIADFAVAVAALFGENGVNFPAVTSITAEDLQHLDELWAASGESELTAANVYTLYGSNHGVHHYLDADYNFLHSLMDANFSPSIAASGVSCTGLTGFPEVTVQTALDSLRNKTTALTTTGNVNTIVLANGTGGTSASSWTLVAGILDANASAVKNLYSKVVTLATGTSAPINPAEGNHFSFTPNGNYTINIQNAPANYSGVITLSLVGGGAYTPTFSNVVWGDEGIPTLSGVGKRDVLTFLWDGAVWIGGKFATGLAV